MIDVHCHLEHESFKTKIEEVIEGCKIGLKAVITCATHLKDFDYTLNLCKRYSGFVFCSIGLHPEYIEEIDEKVLRAFIDFVEKNKENVVSIGEIGLDYFWVKDEKLREKQKEYFESLVDFAKRVEKPVTIHIREAYEDAIKILEKKDYQRVHLHMFGGDKFLDKILSNEWRISVGPILLRSKTHKKIVKKTPIERIMLETDAPWMKLEGKPSLPTDVIVVAKKVAEIKGMSLEEVEKVTDMNVIEFFGLKTIQLFQSNI